MKRPRSNEIPARVIPSPPLDSRLRAAWQVSKALMTELRQASTSTLVDVLVIVLTDAVYSRQL